VDVSDPLLDDFAQHISYFPLNFDDPDDYAGLKAELDRIDKEKNIGGSRLFYLATAPEFLPESLRILAPTAWRSRRRAQRLW